MTTVYIICVESDSPCPYFVVGAAYLNEEDAKAEVQRLKEANSFTKAYYVTREAR